MVNSVVRERSHSTRVASWPSEVGLWSAPLASQSRALSIVTSVQEIGSSHLAFGLGSITEFFTQFFGVVLQAVHSATLEHAAPGSFQHRLCHKPILNGERIVEDFVQERTGAGRHD